MVLKDFYDRHPIMEGQEVHIPVEIRPPSWCEPGLDRFSLIKIQIGGVHVEVRQISDLGINNGSWVALVNRNQGSNIESVISDFRQIL